MRMDGDRASPSSTRLPGPEPYHPDDGANKRRRMGRSAASRGANGVSSGSRRHRLDLSRSPGSVEERLERAVEAEQREPALAGNGLDPVLFGDAFRALR